MILYRINSTYRRLFYIIVFFNTFTFFGQTNQSPTVTAVGDQIYCPQSQQTIVTSFDITDPDDSTIAAFYIQISSGYVLGEDLLSLPGGLNPNITANWNASEAKLTLTGVGGGSASYSDIIAAVYDVVFSSSNLNVEEKTFSLSAGSANFLENGHYYDFVPSNLITWRDAKIAAENMIYFGLQGYLATLTSPAEAQIAGELTPGTGWIGGSDEATEGVWKWVTGPETGMTFWNGLDDGAAPAGIYSNWNNSEPNNSGDEDYAHITDLSETTIPGSWNDLPNPSGGGPYQSTGFVVEYGGMPGDPTLSISTTTSFSPAQILTTSPSVSCGNTPANLSATANTTDILWYDNPSGGTLLHTGATYSPVLTTTTTFWVLASSNGCTTGTRISIIATVNPAPDIDAPADVSSCDSYILPALTNGNYFTATNGGGTPMNAGDMITSSMTLFVYAEETTAPNCTDETSFVITMSANTNSTFTPIDAICIGDTLTLPTTSIEGFTGNWSPPINTFLTTTYVFTPDASQCANATTKTIVVDQKIAPTFTHLTTICEGSVSPLISSSNEGVTGNWTPAFDNTATTNYTFTPFAGQCAESASQTITVNPLTTPTFTQIDPICVGDVLLSLPTTSTNGTDGSWSPVINNTATTEYTFTPTPIAGICFEEIKMTITVLTQTTPLFTQVDPVCIGSTLAPLPTTSNAGITGAWSPVINNLVTTPYTFTPDPNQCADPTTMTIVVNPISTLSISATILSEDFDANQIISVTATGGSGTYEYQLDGGAWLSNAVFENVLGCNEHTVAVRDALGCSTIPEEKVMIMAYPKFFTPNGDGFNDSWNIDCLAGDPSAVIRIFDRYGKLLIQFKPSQNAWNGTFNGAQLTGTDYWFVVSYQNSNAIETQFKSHFSLKR